ncbi:permease prefix domain 1-containing protein [Clostridium sp. C8-1-8]|uniref:permease prefix domain 1-containing protein n=1 Tax=Clostridium sp. C8-1-8 TaxID=2698831 RepID=UPI00136B69A7|nr:permease prefix domain 1-containing protein [Clostridium sp. C8-1-8]
MKEIDNYINSIYKNADDDFEEIEEIKNDMRQHLIETVEELKREGKSEAESIKIAIERFGEAPWIKAELSKVIPFTRKHFSISLCASLSMIGILLVVVITLANYAGNKFLLDGTMLSVLAVPIYIIIRASKLESIRKSNQETDLKKEGIRLLFIISIFYIIGSAIHQFGTFPNYNNKVYYSVSLIPLSHMIDVTHRGVPIYVPVISCVKVFISYLVVGALSIIVSSRYKKLSACIGLGGTIFLIATMLNYSMSILGLTLVRTINFDVDYLISCILGTVVGWFIYSKKIRKS